MNTLYCGKPRIFFEKNFCRHLIRYCRGFQWIYQKLEMGLRMRIKHKIGLMFFIILVLFSTSILMVVSSTVKQIIENSLGTYSSIGIKMIEEIYPGEWEIREGKMYKGNVLMNENYQFVDMFTKDEDIVATIFQYDERISTNIVTSDGERAIGTKLGAEIAQIVLERGELYKGTAEILEKSYLTFYMPIKNNSNEVIGIWFVGIGSRVVAEELKGFMLEMVAVIIVGILIAITIGYVFAYYICRNINKAVTFSNQLAQKDLTYRVTITSKDETGEMLTALNESGKMLHDFMKKVLKNSDLLKDASEQLAASVEQSNQGMEEITAVIHNVTESSQNNASIVEQTNASIQELATSSEVVTDRMQSISNNSKNVLRASQFGEEKVKEVVTSINQIRYASKESMVVIEELKKASDRIGEMVTFITNISDQTNLLALNAAIEAARAGEHGKGFAVVANEIRTLAEQTKKSATEITQSVSHIQSKTMDAKVTMEKSSVLVETGVDKAHNTQEQFQTIVKSIEEIAKEMQDIILAAKQQTQISQDMTKAMEHLAHSIQDTASSAEEMSSGVEEQVSSFEEIGATAENLSEMSMHLKEMIATFKV
jgi:methyl-accepting chemotaxis protein